MPDWWFGDAKVKTRILLMWILSLCDENPSRNLSDSPSRRTNSPLGLISLGSWKDQRSTSLDSRAPPRTWMALSVGWKVYISCTKSEFLLSISKIYDPITLWDDLFHQLIDRKRRTNGLKVEIFHYQSDRKKNVMEEWSPELYAIKRCEGHASVTT
jgi:hypothetical protein